MNKTDLYNLLIQSNDKKIIEILDKVYGFNSVNFNEYLFTDSTPTFQVNAQLDNNDQNSQAQWEEPLNLKHAIPDSFLEDLLTEEHENIKKLLQFYNVFFSQVLKIDNFVNIKKEKTLYINKIKGLQTSLRTINNRKNIGYLFRHFFSNEPIIIENVPHSIKNMSPIFLGKAPIYSKLRDESKALGLKAQTVLIKYYIIIDIKYSELENLSDFIKHASNEPSPLILKSNRTTSKDKDNDKLFRYQMVFLGPKLQSVSRVNFTM